MQQLILVLRRSRLIQVLLVLIFVALASAAGYLVSDARVLSSLSVVLLSGVLALLALRLVQLEWRVATADKSAISRKLEFEKKLDALARSLRAELSEQAISVGSGGVALPLGVTPRAARSAALGSAKPERQNILSTSLVIGRDAARVPESEARQLELQRFLYPSDPHTRRQPILGVLSPELKLVLDERYDVIDVSPSLAREQTSTAAGAIFVIDERAFAQGPWFGADGAGGTALFSELTSAVDLAASQGSVVLFVDTGAVPKPYTNTLRNKAAGVVGLNATDPHWVEEMQLEFAELMDEYVMGLGK